MCWYLQEVREVLRDYAKGSPVGIAYSLEDGPAGPQKLPDAEPRYTSSLLRIISSQGWQLVA